MGRVIVAGSVNMDVSARVQQQPRPGETVFGSELLFTPGGKGSNQAVAASRLYGEATAREAVTFIGKIGVDAFGRELRAFLERENLDLTGLRESANLPSGTALISVDGAGENQIIVIPGSNAEMGAEEVAEAPLGPGDIAAAVFEIPQETIVSFFRRARERGARTLLNPAPYAKFHRDLPALCDVLILNEVELAGLAGLTTAPQEEGDCLRVMHAAQQFHEQTLVVTLGGEWRAGAGGGWLLAGAGYHGKGGRYDRRGRLFRRRLCRGQRARGGATGGPRLRQRRCRPERNATRRERGDAHAGGGNRDSLADG